MRKRPNPKDFDTSQYGDIINSLDKNMSEIEFERLSEIVVPDILQNYQGFTNVIKGPDFRGTLFDFSSGTKTSIHTSLSSKVL